VDHPKTNAFKNKLLLATHEVDQYLEDKYKGCFPLHPNRPERGTTSNPQMDGLFNVGLSFSPGYGSKFGRGYVLDLTISTLAKVPHELREKIQGEAVDVLKNALKKHLPERDLQIDWDHKVYKIHGDLSLGSLN